MKNVDGVDGFLAALFVAKDEINPGRQRLSDNVGLQRLAMN